MKIAIFAYSRQGCHTVRSVQTCFPESEWVAYTIERLVEKGFSSLPHPTRPFYGTLFDWADALIFVGSCGIAVRAISPYVKDKRTDPAVLCIDELGRFVIPLLSGHIGRANEIARQLASHLDATPVITTATDINNRFSVDTWAVKHGFVIDDLQRVKTVSSAILEQDIPLSCDFPIITAYPNGVVPGEHGTLGICISWQKKTPFSQTLRLIPQILHLGIGCRKGTTEQTICHAAETMLAENEIDLRAIKCVASIDLKAEETGLLNYCRENDWPLLFYAAEELQDVPGEFTPSEFVRSITGVDNVCERAALLGAERLIIKKTAIHGVTVAVAAEKLEVRFE